MRYSAKATINIAHMSVIMIILGILKVVLWIISSIMIPFHNEWVVEPVHVFLTVFSNLLTPRAFLPRMPYWEFQTFSAWVWNTLVAIYSKKHFQHGNMASFQLHHRRPRRRKHIYTYVTVLRYVLSHLRECMKIVSKIALNSTCCKGFK